MSTASAFRRVKPGTRVAVVTDTGDLEAIGVVDLMTAYHARVTLDDGRRLFRYPWRVMPMDDYSEMTPDERAVAVLYACVGGAW